MSQLDELRAAGFSDAEVNGYAAQQSKALSAAGFTDAEIAQHLGPQPAAPAPSTAAGNRTFSRVLGRALVGISSGFKEAQTTTADVASVYAPIEAALNAGTGLLFGFPAYVGGGLGGLIAKHALGLDADPKELAETMSKVFTYQPLTQRGQRLAGNVMYPLAKLTEGADWTGERATDVATHLGASDNVAAAVGAVTSSSIQMLAPALIGELARKMGGQVINADDMRHTAQVVAGPDAAPAAVVAAERSLRGVYDQTGIGPYTVLEHAQRDPQLRAELVDPAVEVPQAYQPYVERPQAPEVPIPGDGAPLLDVSEPAPVETLPQFAERIGDEIGGVSHLRGIVSSLARTYVEQGREAGRAMLENMAQDAPESSGFAKEVATKGFLDELDAELASRAAQFRGEQTQPPGLGREHQVGTLETREVPVKDITLSQDVPQFKSDANARGVVEPLGGSFDRTGVAPIQLWQRIDGRLEVISGRHRLDLAERTGEKTIPAQVHQESEGFDVRRAAALDAELNIRDGQGKVRDYVDYFRSSRITGAEAEQRGLLARAVGKRAYAIATDGSDELVASHRAGQISDEAAVAIAGAAPGDARLQAVGIKAVQDGKTIGQAANTVRAVKLLAGDRADTTGDMFGFDDSAMKEAEQMAKIATAHQRDLQARISAISGAAKRPELAAAEGIDVKDSAAVLFRVEELRTQRAAWDNWSTSPELVETIRRELHPDGGEGILSAQTVEDLRVKTEREANAAALDQRAQIDAEREHFQLQGQFEDHRTDTTGDIFGQPSSATHTEGAGTLNAGLNPAAVLSSVRDSYTPFVGVEADHAKPRALDSSGAPRNKMMDDLRRVFAPASRGEIAAKQAGIMRANFGEMAHEREVALARLKETAALFDAMPVAENIKFIDAMERGTSLEDARLGQAAEALRALLDAKRDQVRALGKGQLENYDENYFPHIWKDEKAAEALFARRPLEGSRAFLKQRTIPLTTDGLRWRAYDAEGDFLKSFDTEAEAKVVAGSAGRVGKPLVPITTNPVELALLKAREMDKYIAGQKIFAEMKDADLARFVRFGQQALPGWTKIDDRIARVYLPSEIPIHEAYDKLLMQRLEKFAEDIGVEPERRVKIGGAGRWGYASRAGDVVTKFGGPETVLTHELGHQLDFKYGLEKQFVNDPATKKELRALADLRFEGSNAETSFRRYVRRGTEKMANMVHAYVHMPDRFQEVAPNTFAKFNEFLDQHPELSGLRDIKPSLVLQSKAATVNAGGAVIAGEFYAPEEAATLLNNHLSAGLQGNGFYDAWRGIGNTMNGMQLGLSFFHVGFTTMDAMISKAALGMKQISRGDVLTGLGNVAQGLNPAQPILNVIKGDLLLRAYLGDLKDPDLLPMVEAIQQAGGRVKMDDFYRNAQVNSFKQALRNEDYWGAAKAFLPTVLDRMMSPIFEELVPRQKLGVFFDMARDWLEKNPDADVATKREAYGKLWDSVDNRMGQLVYDNLFWNRSLKDGLMATVRSVGWNLGTFRELGGGLLDIKKIAENKGFSDRTAYIVALPFITAVYGSILNYLYTGEAPQTLKDVFYPRTGRKRPDGTDDRVSLPTYMKDVFAYGEDAKNFALYGGDPTQTLKNKAHPLISTVSQMLNNADFFGGAIRNPGDPIVKQMEDEAAYIAQQVQPFSIRNYQQQAKLKGEEPSFVGYMTSPSMIGVTPAPAHIVKSPEQNESAQVSRMRDALIQKYREEIKRGGDPAELVPAMIRGGLTRADIRYIIKSSGDVTPQHRLKSFGDGE